MSEYWFFDFTVFTDDARIQIHGCNTARGLMPGNTLVEEISEQIYKVGRKNAYVIGHTDKSNPNINGPKTMIKQQDYRHGERSIYHNGGLLMNTNKKGIIEHAEIQRLIKQ